MAALALYQLSEKKIKKLKNGMYADGGNLYLNIRGNSRSWVFRFKSPITEKIRMMGLGSLPDITLEMAREHARKNRLMLRNDLDPLQQKIINKAKNKKTFQNIATEYIEYRSKQWKGKKTKQEFQALLTNYIFPIFNERPIQSITLDDILVLLKSIWHQKTVTALKIQGLLDRIFKYAIAHGWFQGNNPAQWNGLLENILPKPSLITKVEHRKAYPWQNISTLYKKIKSINDIPHLAICLICLTACRSAEVREMRIEEVDFKEKIWILPAARSKNHKEHRVPLSNEALSIIQQALALHPNKAGYVFEHNAKPIYDKAVLAAVKNATQDKDMTLHGFRSSFRDWGSETTYISSDILEMALSHTIKSKIESAYRRGDMLDKRRVLMNEWAKYCLGQITYNKALSKKQS